MLALIPIHRSSVTQMRFNMQHETVKYDGIMLWKEVVEYVEKHPTARVIDVANAVGCNRHIVSRYVEDWRKNHREAVIMSKSL